MARFRYEAEGRVPPQRFVDALIDFSERRPQLWPRLSPSLYQVHRVGDTWAEVTEGTDVLRGVWAREHYDWSEEGVVRLTLLQSPSFVPGTRIVYRVSTTPTGCRVAVDFHRRARGVKGRIVGALLQLTGPRVFAADLREALRRLEAPTTDSAAS